LGQNGIKTGVHKFFWGVLQLKPRASAVSFGSLAVENMLLVVENRTEMAENGQDAEPTFRPFFKEFVRGRRFGPNFIETGVHNFFLGALQPKLRASAVSLGYLAVGMYALSCGKLDRNGRKRARRKSYPSAILQRVWERA